MFDVGCDLLRMASLALAARGFEPLGENLLRLGVELMEDAAWDIEPRRAEQMLAGLDALADGRGGGRPADEWTLCPHRDLAAKRPGVDGGGGERQFQSSFQCGTL